MIKPHTRVARGVTASLLLLAGCAQQPPPPDQNAFIVRDIDPVAEGGVKVKLESAGSYAEADENLLVAYVKIVAVHEATRRQREVAEAAARKITREMAARKEKPKARYLAVRTQLSAPSKAGPFKESVILWDTQSESIVGKSVYDIAAPPPPGRVFRFETFSAQFVGGEH